MSLAEELRNSVTAIYEVDAEHASTQSFDFPLMELGTAFDMGHDANGIPLVDPRIFDSREFGT